MWPILQLAFLGLGLSPLQADHEVEVQGLTILVPWEAGKTFQEDLFLMAIPATTNPSQQEPMVLLVDAAQPWRPELLDFLRRDQPTQLLWLGSAPKTVPEELATHLQVLASETPSSAAQSLFALAWPQGVEQAVFYDPADRAAAVMASCLAARLHLPLLPTTGGEVDPGIEQLLRDGGLSRGFFVGDGVAPQQKDWRIERLKNAAALGRWLLDHGHEVSYVALANSNPQTASNSRHLALAAPLLAAAHAGIVLPIDFETHWKQRYPAEEAVAKKPRGAAESAAGWRRGSLSLPGAKATAFLLGKRPEDGRWWLQVDHNHDGSFRGSKEQALFTGDELSLGDQSWAVDLDAVESERGQTLWLTSPTAAEISAALADFRKRLRHIPPTLCLLGWPQELPMAIIDHGQGIDTDLVSDLPFAQIDEDPFADLAFARFLADDLPSATLLACRGFARDDFPERGWEGRLATAEWEDQGREPLQFASQQATAHHGGGAAFQPDSPLADVGLIVHGSHASWMQMGETYFWNSDTLLAPALILSAGCSTASLDQDAAGRSVASRLLRNGAVAFVGNSRRGIAQQELFLSELSNALLAGQTLGEAQRSAQNIVLVAALEKGQGEGGAYYYQLYHQLALGDPGLQLGLSYAPEVEPAHVTQSGTTVEVFAPSEWRRSAYVPLAEWGGEQSTLWAWRGAGVGVEGAWQGAEKRDEEDLIYTVAVRTKRKVNQVKVLEDCAAPLGWTGSCFVDEHADGSRSLYWRVRFLDADKSTGVIRGQLAHLRFRLVKD